ncbi:hypothetical protein [Desulfobacula sp.]
MIKKISICLMFFLFSSISHAAGHYHWIDKDGTHIFSNYLKPPTQRGDFTFSQS